MNTQEHDTDQNGEAGQDTGRDSAVVRAELGSAGWEDAVRLQRWATPDHADFYALAGEIVSTLYALDDLAAVVHRQASRYGQGRRLYDDTRQVDPTERLQVAASALQELHLLASSAADRANRFWTAIGHIGVDLDAPQDATTETDTDQTGTGSRRSGGVR
jgi:hypothetical protein